MADIGVKADSDPNDTELMFHRTGLRVGAFYVTPELYDRPEGSSSVPLMCKR